jgi:hypothetical protein
MRTRLAALVVAGFAACLLAAPPAARTAELSDYSIKDLLEPCMEGDNDSRWGEVALQECEQYIRGFVDAYLTMVAGGAGAVACLPPEGNRDTEIRWAFMKWAHKNFDRRNEPAAAGLMATLRDVFECN